jgi:hypothetical protein
VSALLALIGVDIVLDVLNWDDIPIRTYIGLVAVISLASGGTALVTAHDRGVKLGQRIRLADEDTDSVVVPMPRPTRRGRGRRHA